MSVEFVVGMPLMALRSFAKEQGWRECGRADWRTKDGANVHYLCFAEQIEALTAGATVHVVGKVPELVRLLKRTGAIIVRY
jgi:hypothetical protein